MGDRAGRCGAGTEVLAILSAAEDTAGPGVSAIRYESTGWQSFSMGNESDLVDEEDDR